MQCHGFTCALAGFTVAYKQTNPQKKLTVPNVGLSIDARFAPAIFTGATVGLYLLGAVRLHVPLMAMQGIMVAWVFLRFFQTKEDSVRGDPSDNFTFADLFPSNLQVCPVLVCRCYHHVSLSLPRQTPLLHRLARPLVGGFCWLDAHHPGNTHIVSCNT